VKIVFVDTEIFGDICSFLVIFSRWFSSELRDLGGYWTEVYQIYMLYSLIIATSTVLIGINFPIRLGAIVCRMKVFRKFWPKLVYHSNEKRRPDTQTTTNNYHVVKIGPVDPEIIGLRAIINKVRKRISTSKTYSRFGKFAEWAKFLNACECGMGRAFSGVCVFTYLSMRICLSVRDPKGKRLELSTSNWVEIVHGRPGEVCLSISLCTFF